MLLTQKWPISATIDLDEMTYDPETGSFSTPCRCSGCYIITEAEMEKGVDTVNCSTCTLSIHVLYHEEDWSLMIQIHTRSWGAAETHEHIRLMYILYNIIITPLKKH